MLPGIGRLVSKNRTFINTFHLHLTGGGAIDMEISKHLREYAKGIAGKEQLLIAAVARAFEAVPRQLCDNAGFDATNLLNKLRNKHHNGEWDSLPSFRSSLPAVGHVLIALGCVILPSGL